MVEELELVYLPAIVKAEEKLQCRANHDLMANLLVVLHNIYYTHVGLGLHTSFCDNQQPKEVAEKNTIALPVIFGI